MKLGYLIVLVGLVGSSLAWDASDFEIFDLVEEINDNFYNVMNISEDATGNEIKRAFRSLSITLHPDKNPAEDANVKFRNLVSVYEVLKDTEKREKYDLVLKNGMPSWKSGIWYYRKIRKMGLWESSLILFSIITVGQYLIAWGAYLEKKHTAEQVLGSKLKKIQKKSKSGVDLANILNEIPKPSIYNTLPFQIPMFFWNLPSQTKQMIVMYREMRREEQLKKEEEEEEERRLQEEEEEYIKHKEESKALKKRKVFVAPEKTDKDLAGYSSQLTTREDTGEGIRAVNNSKSSISGGFWTDDDLTELIRLVKKYPGGMSNRWETIAEMMNRSVPEVTFMAAKLKENNYRLVNRAETKPEVEIKEKVKKPKAKANPTDANQIIIPEANWSQEQQRALETAIGRYPKGSSADRWQKIANCVPEKTKEECMLRYKYLVDLVKKQKEAKEEEEKLEAAAKEPEEEEPEPVEVIEEVVEEEEPVDTSKGKGKPRNKRKERKKQMELDLNEYEEYDQ